MHYDQENIAAAEQLIREAHHKIQAATRLLGRPIRIQIEAIPLKGEAPIAPLDDWRDFFADVARNLKAENELGQPC